MSQVRRHGPGFPQMDADAVSRAAEVADLMRARNYRDVAITVTESISILPWSRKQEMMEEIEAAHLKLILAIKKRARKK